MSEVDNTKNQPSLPPNYLTILQLQEQWLKKKQKQKEEDEAKLKQIEIQTEQKKQELAAQKQIRLTQQHQRQGNCVKSNGNVEKSILGRFQGSGDVEKSSLGRFQGSDNGGKSSIGRFQGSDNVEKSSLGRFQRSDDVEKSSLGRFQGSDNGEKPILGRFQGPDNGEKSSLGRFQGSDRSGFTQRRDYNRNYGKGVYKDKGKGKIGEVGERRVDSERGDFERRDGKVRNNGAGGGFGEVMSLRVVAVEEDVNVGVKKQDDGFRGGLTSNVGDLRANKDVSENLGEGGTMMETKQGLERGRKVDDGAMRAVNKKNGPFRSSRVNKGGPLVNVGDSDNVRKRECMEEREEVLQGKGNAKISDMGLAIEVGNVAHRSKCGQKKNQNKKGLSMSEFGRGTEQGQKNGRDVREEDEIQMDLKKENAGINGEGRVGNIGDVEVVADMGVAIKFMNVEQKSRGRHQKNRNKKGLSKSEFLRGTEQGQGNGRNVQEEKAMQSDLKTENGKKIGKGSGDNVGDVKDVADRGVEIGIMNEEQKSRGGWKKNRNIKGLSRIGFERGTEQGNGRDVRVENGIQLDLENENGENIGKGSGDNTGDVKDVANIGVAIEIMNVEQKRKGKHKKNLNKKDLFRSEFGRGVEQGQGNGRDMEEGNIIQLDLKKENGGKITEGSADNIGDGNDVSDMGVAVEVMNVEQRSRGGYKKRNKTGLSRSDFGRGTGQGQESGRGSGEEVVVQLDMRKETGEKIGEERSGDNMGDGDPEAEKRARLREWKHNRLSVGRRNVNGREMDRTRGVTEIWAVKGVSARAEIIKVTVEEKPRTDESVDEIPVVLIEINEKTNLCSDGSQRNEFQDNTTEKRENLKPELFGEHDDNCPLMTNEANGESKTKGNRDGEGFSRPKSSRDLKEHSLYIQRVSNGRKNGQMYGHNQRLEKHTWPGDKQRGSGSMWVNKGCNAGVDVPET